jgi:hypothetical protein
VCLRGDAGPIWLSQQAMSRRRTADCGLRCLPPAVTSALPAPSNASRHRRDSPRRRRLWCCGDPAHVGRRDLGLVYRLGRQAPIASCNCLFQPTPASTCDSATPTSPLSPLASHDRNIRQSLVWPCQAHEVEESVHALDCFWQVSLFHHVYQCLLIAIAILSPADHPLRPARLCRLLYHYTACPSWAVSPVSIWPHYALGRSRACLDLRLGPLCEQLFTPTKRPPHQADCQHKGRGVLRTNLPPHPTITNRHMVASWPRTA